MLSAPPGLEGFNTKKGYADEKLGSSESTEATVMADFEGDEEDAKSLDRSRTLSSDPEPEEESDPNSGCGSPVLGTTPITTGSYVHDMQHWLWMQQQMTNGYCQDLYTGANHWGMPGYDSAAWSQIDTVQMAASLQAASLQAASLQTAALSGDGNNICNLMGLTAGNSKMIDPVEWSNTCTVVMQNLPSQVTRELLTAEIDNAGFLHAYDFIDLQMDPATNTNCGWALINFTTPGLALMFKMHFDGRKLVDKVVSVVPATVPVTLQGFDANFAASYKKAVAAATDRTMQEAAKPGCIATRREGKRGGRHKASLIDIAARSHNVSVVDAIQPPPGLCKKESPPCITKQTPKSPKQAAAEESPEKYVLNFCPYCGGTLKEGFKFCRFCGSSLAV